MTQVTPWTGAQPRMSPMTRLRAQSPAWIRRPDVRGLLLALALAAPVAAFASEVYRWVDDEGVTHLSSQKPPAGVRYERVAVAGTSRRTAARSSASASPGLSSSGTPAQRAQREAAVATLQHRECVVALESIDRLARSGRAVDEDEFRRLQQTADRNCSQDPVRRREQEAQAAKLRVAKGDACVEARNRLAEMLEPGRRPTREQLKLQQEFIEAHCTAPVR
jgi:hypothetical protein